MEQALMAMLHEIQRAGNDLREQVSAMQSDVSALRRDFEEALGGDFRTAKDGLVAKVDRAQRDLDTISTRIVALETELQGHQELRGVLRQRIDELSQRVNEREHAKRTFTEKIRDAVIVTVVPVVLLSLVLGVLLLVQQKLS